jgi:predicted porin
MNKLMSKILFALIAISMVAVSAQAATVFQKDGLTFNINGDLQVQLRQDNGDDQDLDVEFDDLEIKNSVSYELKNGLTAFGELDFSGNSAAEAETSSILLEEGYVGLGYQNYSVLIGKTDNAADSFGVYGGLESYNSDDAFDLVGVTGGDDLIMVKADFDMVSVIVDYELEADSEDSGEADYNEVFNILVSANIAGIDAAVAYENIDTDSDDVDIYGISLAYDAEVIWVGADYSVADSDGDKASEWNIVAEVPVTEATTIGAGYNYLDVDDEDEVGAYYFNVQHMLHENVKVFAEIGDNDIDDSDMGYLAGLQVKF